MTTVRNLIKSTVLVAAGALLALPTVAQTKGSSFKMSLKSKKPVKLKRVKITNAQALYQAPKNRFLVRTDFEYSSLVATIAEPIEGQADRTIEHGAIYKLGLEYGWTNNISTSLTLGGAQFNATDDVDEFERSGLIDTVASLKARNFVSSTATVNYGLNVHFSTDDQVIHMEKKEGEFKMTSGNAQLGRVSVNPFFGLQTKIGPVDVVGVRLIQTAWNSEATQRIEGLPETESTPGGIDENILRGGAVSDVKAFWEHRTRHGSIEVAGLYKYVAEEEIQNSPSEDFEAYSEPLELAGAEVSPRWRVAKDFDIIAKGSYLVTTSDKETLYRGQKIAGSSVSNVSLGFRYKF